MADWLALDRCRRASPAPVAPWRWPTGTRLDHAAFRDRVEAWRDAFAARAGQRWALYFDDAGRVRGGAVRRLACRQDGVPVRRQPAGDGVPAAQRSRRLRRRRLQRRRCGRRRSGHAVQPRSVDADWTRTPRAWSFSPPAPPAMPTAIDKTPVATRRARSRPWRRRSAPRWAMRVVHGTVSHQHIYGLLFRVLWPLAAGRAIAPRVVFHEEIVAALDRARVAGQQPGPSQAHARFAGLVGCAHAPACGVQFRRRAAAGRRRRRPGGCWAQAPTEIYGSTETGGIAWRQRRGRRAGLARAAGRATGGSSTTTSQISSPHLPTRQWWRSEDRAESDGRDGFRLARPRRPHRQDRGAARVAGRAGASTRGVAGSRAKRACWCCRRRARSWRPSSVPSAAGAAQLAADGRRAFARVLRDALASAQ